MWHVRGGPPFLLIAATRTSSFGTGCSGLFRLSGPRRCDRSKLARHLLACSPERRVGPKRGATRSSGRSRNSALPECVAPYLPRCRESGFSCARGCVPREPALSTTWKGSQPELSRPPSVPVEHGSNPTTTAKKRHATQVRRQKKLLRELGVPDLSPEEVTERARRRDSSKRRPLITRPGVALSRPSQIDARLVIASVGEFPRLSGERGAGVAVFRSLVAARSTGL